jgi:predicted NBD/HSP70 family sugar kinase
MANGATTRDLRIRNRANVLRQVVLSQETTRAGLALACQLSAATVTKVVGGLLREGLLEERGLVPSDGGRPIARIGVKASSAYFLGADVGERDVAVELFDLSFTRLDTEYREGQTRDATPAEIGTALHDAVSAIRARNPQCEERLVGLGLGLPGIVEDASGLHGGHGVVLYAQSLGWPPVHLDEFLDVDGLDIFADNGAKALATAEMWLGSVRGIDHALVVLLGRGIGLGVVAEGALVRGLTSSAGEWGHVKVGRGGPLCRCGAYGCLEAYVGADAILRRWADAGGNPAGSGWHALTALVAAADAGDDAAVTVLDETVEVLAVALSNLVNLTNPERIVVGGWVGLCLMQSRRKELETQVRAASLERPGGQFSLELCRFEGDSVSLGAALLPLQRLIDHPVTKASL